VTTKCTFSHVMVDTLLANLYRALTSYLPGPCSTAAVVYTPSSPFCTAFYLYYPLLVSFFAPFSFLSFPLPLSLFRFFLPLPFSPSSSFLFFLSVFLPSA